MPNGSGASLADANNHVTSYTYDGFDRLSTASYPDSSTETLSYDADGNVLSRLTRANQTIQFTYDTLNRLSTKTPPAPWAAVSYAYDVLGRPTKVADNSAAIAPAVPTSASSVQYAPSYSYHTLNRPTNVCCT